MLSHIPIINYHKIEPIRDIGITSRHPDQFRRDLELIQRLGLQPLTFHDIFRSKNIPQNSIVITFDDGYESIVSNALPIMREFGFRGVVLVPSDFIGRTNDWDVQFNGLKFRHLNRDHLIELVEQGFEIGSHGCSHRLLTMMPDKEIREELQSSKKILEDLTGNAVVTIGYPFGRFNKIVLDVARQAGYRYGLASLYWRSVQSSEVNLALKRSNIYRFEGMRGVAQKLVQRSLSWLDLRDWFIQKGGLATVIYQSLSDRLK